MTKRFCLVLTVLMLYLLSTPVMAKTIITHYHYPGHGIAQTEWLNEMAKVFNANHPDIEVQIMVASSGGEYATKFSVMLAAGTPPDVTDFHPALGATFLINGAFTDLRPYLERDNINLQRLTSASVVSMLTSNTGAIWGLPADIFPVVTFYNEEYFDRAGLPHPKDLGAAWNWDQAILSARKLTIDSNGDGTPEQWGMDRAWTRWYMWVHQTGAMLYDRVLEPTKSNWNDPRVAQGLKFPLTIMNEGIGFKPSTPNYSQLHMWLGKSAFSLVDGPGAIGAYFKDTDLRYNIAPQVHGPANNATEITMGVFEMVDTSPNKDAAWEWLKFISLDVDAQARFVEMTGRAPSLSVLQRRYQQLCPYLPSNYMAFFEAASAPGSQPNYIIADPAINNAVNPIINQVWAGTIPVETATAQIHEMVSAIFAAK